MNTTATSVLGDAISELRLRQTDVYTFALYFDHESSAMSVCADTIENSAITVRQTNNYNRKYFDPTVESGDLQAASLRSANIGRSVSLGNFVVKNLARTQVARADIGEEFYRGMLRALMQAEDKVVTLSSNKNTLLLCCSGPSDEVEFYWSPRA
jgi:hypothetical protein